MSCYDRPPLLVSIVVPAYNEQGSIVGHVEDILAYRRARRGAELDFELLVVDDGSTDRTAELVAERLAGEPGAQLLQLDRNRGKGAAVRRGLLATRGDVRGFTDADQSTPIDQLDRVLEALEGVDVVIGSRARRDRETEVEARLHRRLIGRAFNGVLRTLVGLEDVDGRPIADSQCGFKWFRREACEQVFSRSVDDGFAFDVEALYLTIRLGFTVRELPVTWRDAGDSQVNLWVDPIKMFGAVCRVPWRHRQVHGGAAADLTARAKP